VTVIVFALLRHGVFCSRMLSSIGRNAQYCCSRYASLASFTSLNKSSVWRCVRVAVSAVVWNRVLCTRILELLHFFTLELFTQSELESVIYLI